jgi:hypothetical protein
MAKDRERVRLTTTKTAFGTLKKRQAKEIP